MTRVKHDTKALMFILNNQPPEHGCTPSTYERSPRRHRAYITYNHVSKIASFYREKHEIFPDYFD